MSWCARARARCMRTAYKTQSMQISLACVHIREREREREERRERIEVVVSGNYVRRHAGPLPELCLSPRYLITNSAQVFRPGASRRNPERRVYLRRHDFRRRRVDVSNWWRINYALRACTVNQIDNASVFRKSRERTNEGRKRALEERVNLRGASR